MQRHQLATPWCTWFFSSSRELLRSLALSSGLECRSLCGVVSSSSCRVVWCDLKSRLGLACAAGAVAAGQVEGLWVRCGVRCEGHAHIQDMQRLAALEDRSIPTKLKTKEFFVSEIWWSALEGAPHSRLHCKPGRGHGDVRHHRCFVLIYST